MMFGRNKKSAERDIEEPRAVVETFTVGDEVHGMILWTQGWVCVKCTCGWTGPNCEYRIDACRAWDQHIAIEMKIAPEKEARLKELAEREMFRIRFAEIKERYVRSS